MYYILFIAYNIYSYTCCLCCDASLNKGTNRHFTFIIHTYSIDCDLNHQQFLTCERYEGPLWAVTL